jgi:hypothetical protein
MGLNLGGAVYGTILVGALLAAESSGRETYGETIGGVAVAIVLYWLAHAYATLTGERLRQRTRLTARGLAAQLVSELPMLVGAAVPLLVVIVADLAGASLATALTAGVIAAAVSVVALEAAAAARAELSGRELVGQAILGAVLGCLVLVLKIVLH